MCIYMHQTPKNWRRGLPSPVRLWVAQVPCPLWVGIRNSAMTLDIEPRLEEIRFTVPHRTQKPPENYRTGPQAIGAWVSPDWSDYGIPSILPLWVGTRNSALNLHTGPRLFETSFTLRNGPQTPENYLNGPPKIGAWVSPAW